MGWVNVPYQPQTATGESGGTPFVLVLPSHSYRRELAKRILDQQENGRVVSARQAAVRRPADTPQAARTFVMPNDERDAKDGKPLMVLDQQPGQLPKLLITARTMHWQDMADRLDEEAHYSKGETAELYPNGGRPDVNLAFQRWLEKARDAKVGRRRYGFERRDGLLGEWL